MPSLRPVRILSTAATLAVLPVLALMGCGSKTRADDATGTAAALQAPSAQCTAAVARGDSQVAEHIYEEFAGGRVVEPAVRRLQRSTALLSAVESGDPIATDAALRQLVHGQLARVRVFTAQGRILTNYGSADALAPVTAPLRNAAGSRIGTIVASQQGVRGYVDTVKSFVNAHVLVRAGSDQLAGTTRQAPSTLPESGEVSFAGKHYSVHAFAGSRFPSGPLRVYVLAPLPPPSICAHTSAETVAATIGAAALNIYRGEQSGDRAKAVVRDFERSRTFQQAVATDNRGATEAAIVAFFKSQLHVVRVRATLRGKLVVDLGGPHVLAPIGGRVRNAQGHVVGRFLLSVQDDLGYQILAHRFTGAQVLLRQGNRQVMGNLSPGPGHVPDRGEVVYRGVHYQAYSFLVKAFPTGPLRVSLLIG
jgi:hypothetical protein